MLPKINPTTTSSWQSLQHHFSEMKTVQMKTLFVAESDRFNKYSLSSGDILFDYSKNIITERTIQLFIELANECRLTSAIEAMFNGEKINETENRAVLHTALRNFSGKPVIYISSQFSD